MGDFKKVKQFLLNYQDYINNKAWVELLNEANSVGLDNIDVKLMLEMFKKAKLPITDNDLKLYIEEKIKEIIDLWHQDKNFPFQSVRGTLLLGAYFKEMGIHTAGYSLNFINVLLKNYMAEKLGLYEGDYVI